LKSRFKPAAEAPFMHTMHPTLLIGPADWDGKRMPRDEYRSRIEDLWSDNAAAAGAIVYGNSFDHAALCYLTSFTPKLEAAVALIPRHGEPQLLVGGGVNMIDAARPLTWIERLLPLRNLSSMTADWACGLPAGGRILLIGGGAMPFDTRCALDAALAGAFVVDDGTATLQSRMLRKSSRELIAVREACVGLDRAVAALREAQRSGAGVTAAVLAAEQAALLWGAQDVRSLFSIDRGRTLRPFDVPVAQPADPLQVYLAVRHAGYWAEGFVRVSRAPDPLHESAMRGLLAMSAAAKAGLCCRELARIAATAYSPLGAHPMADSMFGNSIGLALEEPPCLTRTDGVRLQEGAVYSLRAGVVDGKGAGAVVSAMLLATATGNEVLWSTGEQP
jgi:Xaa-Pro aminopeptidase